MSVHGALLGLGDSVSMLGALLGSDATAAGV